MKSVLFVNFPRLLEHISELRDLLEVVEGGDKMSDNYWSSMSKDILERMLVGLTGSKKKFSTPLEISETL